MEIALIVAGVALALAILAIANRHRIEGNNDLRKARALRRDAEEMKQAAEERSGGKITVEHKQDPVLGPRKLLIVVLPDPDWEVIHEMGQEKPTTIVGESKAAFEAFGESDYVVGVFPNNPAHPVVGKWYEYPAEAIEVTAYGASPE